MIIDTLGQVLTLSGLCIGGLVLNRLLRLELTLACLIVGFAFGQALSIIDFDTGIRAYNLKDIIFFVILPVLIFEAAWKINIHLLSAWLLPILLLATFGILLSMTVAAGLAYLGINHPTGFPIIAALLLGSILAASDPIAVINQLQQLKAPDDLTTLFEGESLFNDATAVVLFSVVIAIASDTTDGQSSYLIIFSRVFFGGILFGLLAGLVTSGIIYLISSASASRFILVLSAFASFYIGEHVLHVSGIMSVMMTAILIRYLFRKHDETVMHGVSETWQWLGLYLSCLLFAIMGLVITINMFQAQWLAMLIAIGATLIARFLSVKATCMLSRTFGKPVPDIWQTLLIWGGLRGAIAIALVLSLPVSLPYWWVIQSMVFGVVLFSLLVQGTSNKWLAQRLL